jgi:hypothetical protein
VERFVLEAGHTVLRVPSDYGYDLYVVTHDEDGYVEPDHLRLQLKASQTLSPVGDGFVYDLDIRDYNLWMAEWFPVFLILYDAARRKAYWLFVQQYFDADKERRPRAVAKTVRVRVPDKQVVNLKAVGKMRACKQAVREKILGG